MVNSRLSIFRKSYAGIPTQWLSVVRILLYPESFHEEKWYLPPGNAITPDRDGKRIPLRSIKTAIVGRVLEFDPKFLRKFHKNPTMTSLSSLISQLQVEEHTKTTIVNAITRYCAEIFEEQNLNFEVARNLSVRLELVTTHELEEGELEGEDVERWIREYQEMEEVTMDGLIQKFRMEDHKSEICTICFEDMIAGGSDVGRLSCLHLFHVHCLKQFLKISRKCPLCRRETLPITTS